MYPGDVRTKTTLSTLPAPNKQFGKIAAEAIIHAVVKRFTVRDNPNGVQSSRYFAKPPPRCMQSGRTFR